MKFLHNHLGYPLSAVKKAFIQSSQALSATRFSVYEAESRERVLQGELKALGKVEHWRDWQYWEADFSAVQTPGKYFLLLDDSEVPLFSHTFKIEEALYDGQIISDLVHYLKSQRCGAALMRRIMHVRN